MKLLCRCSKPEGLVLSAPSHLRAGPPPRPGPKELHHTPSESCFFPFSVSFWALHTGAGKDGARSSQGAPTPGGKRRGHAPGLGDPRGQPTVAVCKGRRAGSWARESADGHGRSGGGGGHTLRWAVSSAGGTGRRGGGAWRWPGGVTFGGGKGFLRGSKRVKGTCGRAREGRSVAKAGPVLGARRRG